MAKYLITKQARQLVKDKSPHRSFTGYGVNGIYKVETNPLIKIISCVEKRSKKNA